ncbi:MAG TPA: ABC transporter permease [Bryobacteraceae bacterium]|nr:ABC transporter permease [Bryobacteraceae bacterium]
MMERRCAEIWRYRELLYFLAWREVKVRYKQAALGTAWAIIQPLLAMIIFTLFFGRLAGMPSDGLPYSLFCYCALVPWTYFSGVLAFAGNSLVSNSNLITKVYFPRVLLPAASALAGFVDFLISGSFLVVLMAYYRVTPNWRLLLIPLFIAGIGFLTLGLSMFFAALNVRFRDVKYVLPFLIQIGLFCTPIIYPSTLVPHRFRWLLSLNPCWGLIEGFRGCILPVKPINLTVTATSMAVTLLVFITGVLYFRRTERTFADLI